MKMNDHDSSNVISMINSTADNMKKDNDNSNNIISMINADTASTQNDDDLNNVILTINADAASTHNNKESSNYRSHYNAVEDDSVNVDPNKETKGTKGVSYNDAMMENSKEGNEEP